MKSLFWGKEQGKNQFAGTAKVHHKPEIPLFFLLSFGEGEANSVVSTLWLLMNHAAIPSLQPRDAVLLNHG